MQVKCQIRSHKQAAQANSMKSRRIRDSEKTAIMIEECGCSCRCCSIMTLLISMNMQDASYFTEAGHVSDGQAMSISTKQNGCRKVVASCIALGEIVTFVTFHSIPQAVNWASLKPRGKTQLQDSAAARGCLMNQSMAAAWQACCSVICIRFKVYTVCFTVVQGTDSPEAQATGRAQEEGTCQVGQVQPIAFPAAFVCIAAICHAFCLL